MNINDVLNYKRSDYVVLVYQDTFEKVICKRDQVNNIVQEDRAFKMKEYNMN